MLLVSAAFVAHLRASKGDLAVQGASPSWTRVTDWRPIDQGAEIGRRPGAVLVMSASGYQEMKGAVSLLELNEVAPQGFVIRASSKANHVSGASDGGYCLYLDLDYADGDHLWGRFAPFNVGNHDWQNQEVRIVPSKPVKTVHVNLLFRHHAGVASFRDISYQMLGGPGSFDYQDISAPPRPAEGWYVRDVTHNSLVTPAARGSTLGIKAAVSKLGIRSSIRVSADGKSPLALTLYYCQPFAAKGGSWWNSLRSKASIGDNESGALTNVPSGANGLASLYPFAYVSTPTAARALTVPPDLGPRIFRLFYDPASHALWAAFDVCLTPLNRKWGMTSSAEVLSQTLPLRWGFREAVANYYRQFPEARGQTSEPTGIWMPFTKPASIPHVEDFGIGVHEGDDSIETDAKLGILSFRYTEPMTWWMNMKPEIPRTYEEALQIVHADATGFDPKLKRQAEAVLSSAAYGPDGRITVSFEDQPWANGAVWVLNPNPHLDSKGLAKQSDVDFDLADAAARYSKTKLSGEYLDSLEAHAEVLDYRPETISASTVSPSFDPNTKSPVIPQAYSTYEIALEMSRWLHARGKYLMANTTPVSFSCYMPLLDYAGIEVNWLDGGRWNPDSDDSFAYRRILSGIKPYMLLQNTDFSKFDEDMVRRYFHQCLLYDVFPSFFSADAATNPYWENPKLYDRDRPLFKTMMPIFRKLASAGWNPIPDAESDTDAVRIERYGDRLWAIYNAASTSITSRISFGGAGGSLHEWVEGRDYSASDKNGRESLRLTIPAGECRVLEAR